MRARFLTRGVRLSPTGLLIGLLGLLSLLLLSSPAVDPDYGWHVANGRLLLDGRLLAGRDVFSWTAAGAPWVAHEWLSEGVMAALHDRFGPTANSLLAGGLATAGVLLTVARLRRRGFGLGSSVVVGLMVVLGATVIASVRPLVLELTGLAIILWLIDARADRRISGRRFGVAVLLTMVVWANAHGSFVLGLGALGLHGLALICARDRRACELVLVGGAAAAISLVNPFGLDLPGYVFSALVGSRLALISEWARPDLGAIMWLPFSTALALALVGALISGLRAQTRSGRARTDHGPHLRLDDLALAAVLAVAGLHSGRHAGLFALAAAPLLAVAVSACGARGSSLWHRRSASSAPVRGRLNAALFVLAVGLIGGLIWSRLGPVATRAAVASSYPTGALVSLDATVCADGGATHLLNDYGWGGWLEMVRPTVRVFIDGRSEVYGDAGLARYQQILDTRPGWAGELDAVGVNTALLRRTSILVAALEARGWSLAYQDDVASLLRRPTSSLLTSLDDGSRCPSP